MTEQEVFRLVKELAQLAQDCREIKDFLEADPLDTEASKVAQKLLVSYLSDVVSYLNACGHILHTEEVLEITVRKKLEMIKEFSYGTSKNIVKECFDQMDACVRREDKELKQSEFINSFLAKTFDRLKHFTELLHTYSHPTMQHPERMISSDTYDQVIECVRRFYQRSSEIADKIKSRAAMQAQTEAYITESRQILDEYFAWLKQGYKDPELFKRAVEKIALAMKTKQ